MRISALIDNLGNSLKKRTAADFEIKGVSSNSKAIGKDFLFAAIRGSNFDGARFIDEALSKGARAIMLDSFSLVSPAAKKNKNISFIQVKEVRQALAQAAALFYQNPSTKLKVIGITGTNGKTTVSYLLEAILKEANFSTGTIGTINARFKEKIFASKNTTPGPVELQFLLSEMLKAKTDYAILEVSSHALEQKRTGSLNFHSAIFTNLTQDHLDYHKTMKNYFRSKSKLFSALSSGSFAVINNDDKYSANLKKVTPAEVLTYSINKPALIMAKEIKLTPEGSEFVISGRGIKMPFFSPLIGRHNIYNLLASFAWAQRERIDQGVIKSAIRKFSFVPGRLERIDFEGDFSVFVDYAHTEDALRNVITALRELTQKKIIVVFGCGGERDKNKRPKMGRVVSELADFAIITNDNPRSEDPQAIIKDIRRGINKRNYLVIPERLEAIRRALSLVKSGDIIIVAGKGHENYQILKDKTIEFDDRQAIMTCLNSMNY